jgi:hypothetical protein
VPKDCLRRMEGSMTPSQFELGNFNLIPHGHISQRTTTRTAHPGRATDSDDPGDNSLCRGPEGRTTRQRRRQIGDVNKLFPTGRREGGSASPKAVRSTRQGETKHANRL